MEDTEGTEQQYEWSREGEQVGSLFIFITIGMVPSSEPVRYAFFIHSFIAVP